MDQLSRLTLIELKLVLRDPISLFFVLTLPLGFLLIFGLTAQGGPIDLYLPSMQVTLALGMTGLFTLPTYLAAYREKGILRRMSTTPVHPTFLLIAQLVVNMVLALVALALLIGLSKIVLGIALPQNIVGFLGGFFLGVSAMFSVGLLIAAVASGGRAASALGALLLYPSLFLAGAWLPRSRMPEWLARIGDYTPLGATQQILQTAWIGGTPQVFQLLMMATITMVLSLVATRVFRW
jgi:ABC-2 type transport system permease protein